ncbi:MAG: tetratricopeptide repeat protein [Candidatus Omnitrophota bacterium]
MKTKLLIIIAIFFLALAVRVIYLGEMQKEVLFSQPFADSGDYHFSGMQTAGWAVTESEGYGYMRIPLYDNFLGVLYKWGIPHIFFACLVQAVIGALSCSLIYLLGRMVFGRKVGILSGVAAALYWPFIAVTAKTLPVNLAILFGIATLLSVFFFIKEEKKAWGYLSGIFLALACMTRPNFLLLFPVFLLWLGVVFYKRETTGKALLRAATFFLGFFVVMAIAGALDYSGRKEFIPVQKNYAVTAYMGTDLDLVEKMRPGSSWKARMRELLEKDLVSRTERDSYWLGQIKESITKDPAGFTQNCLKKMFLVLNRYEFSPYEYINYFRSRSRLLSLPLPDFGWVAAFAILGMAVSFTRDRRKMMPLFIFACVYMLSLLPFPPLFRYRLPVVPVFIIFAAYCVMEVLGYIKERRWAKLSYCTAVLVPLFLMTNITPMAPQLETYSRPYYREGRAYLARGNVNGALARLKAALYMHPDDADIYEALGDTYLKLGDLGRARASYESALRIENRFPEAMEKLAIVYAQEGDLDKAVNILQSVLADFPTETAATHINLAACYSKMGDTDSAKEELEKALSLDPGNIQALYLLTELYESTGDPRAAEFRKKLNGIVKNVKNKR